MEKRELLDKLYNVRLELYHLNMVLSKVIYEIIEELDKKEKNIDKIDPERTLNYLNRLQYMIDTIKDALDDFE